MPTRTGAYLAVQRRTQHLSPQRLAAALGYTNLANEDLHIRVVSHRKCRIISCMSNADLIRLWEEHTKHEFSTRDTEATLDTMVDDAYVNHVPTMTGGFGKAALREFYSRDFIPSMPPDTTLTPVSRTVGEDQLVDEMIFSFTHTQEIPWMLPGIAPTNRRVDIPLVAIVRFRGDKLAHEHIYWDQASVLVQIGLLDPKLVPSAGIETAKKVLDKSLPSNTLMRRWSESEGKL